MVTPEGLGGWPVPTDAQIRRLQDLVAHPARLRYFFSRLENPLWLERLADDGWYDPERVPEPIAEADGRAVSTSGPCQSISAAWAGMCQGLLPPSSRALPARPIR